MESPMFTDDDEAETPKTHIQQFLSNVVTDPRYSLSLKKNRKAQSFVKTPDKNAKSKRKYSLRLSTSLPSPGSLITPKTNLQHLLLGNDSAKTPFDRRVASTGSTRLSSKSFSHQPPQEWGQKVSLSPMFASSPSITNNIVHSDSSSKTFKRPHHHRSFRIPEPPTNYVSNDPLRNTDAVNEDDGEVQFDDAYSLNRNDRDESDSPLMTQQNSQHISSSNSALQVVELINKSLQMEKAKKMYELSTSSLDEEDSFTGPEFSSTLKSRKLSSRKSTNKTLDKRDNTLSRRSIDISDFEGSKHKLGTPISSSTKIGDSIRLTNRDVSSVVGKNMSVRDHDIITDNNKIYGDNADISQFQSMSPSKNNTSTNKDKSRMSKSPRKNESLKYNANFKEGKNSQIESPFKAQSSRFSSNTSEVVNKFQSRRSPRAKVADVSGNKQQMSDEGVAADVSMSTSYSDETDAGKRVSSGKKSTAGTISLHNSAHAFKTKVSQSSTPIRIQQLRKSSTSSNLPERSQSSPEIFVDSQNNDKTSKVNSSQSETTIRRRSPRKSLDVSETNNSESRREASTERSTTDVQSQRNLYRSVSSKRQSPRKSFSASGMNNSESKRTPGVKRSTADDQNVDVYQFPEIEVSMDSSQMHSKRRKTNNSLNDLLNEINPSSSTPFKRSKSVFSSTRMQASLSGYLGPKESDFPNNKSVAIGDLSPIRPYNEDGLNVANSDPEDPVDFLMENRPRSQIASTSKNKEQNDDPMTVEGVDEEEDEHENVNNYSPMRTPVVDMNRQPTHLSGNKSKGYPSKATTPLSKANRPALKKAKALSKKKPAKPSSIFPRKTIKFMSELYSSMKIDKEALDELEIITQQFMINTLEAAECYSEHAGRKTITEADFVLMMKKQRLIKTKEDLYDLIRKYLPMELRCELIPCFPSQS